MGRIDLAPGLGQGSLVIVEREDWNRRWESRGLIFGLEPNAFLVEEVEGLRPGRALDLGCGRGRNAVWLAQQGWRVTGVDFSEVALAEARRLARSRGVHVDWRPADLREYVPPAAAFDLVLYLYVHIPASERRLVLGCAAAALAPCGTLLIVGHDLANLTVGAGGPSNPAVLYTPDEIAAELPALLVERVEQMARRVETHEGEAVAIDALVRAVAPTSRGGGER